MADQAGGVEIPHEKIVQALSDRYARALAELHQECAQLQAGLEVAVAERDEARKGWAKASLAREDVIDAARDKML
jgi:hypothetical protein